jgi:uncharacterized protein (DUF305 family)
MDTKILLTGIISFIAGALLVSTAATTFDKKETESIAMDAMVQSLKGKTGEDFDEEFIAQMILHHEGAIEMAKLSNNRAKHNEIKKLSNDILSAQSNEINTMQTWQANLGYRQDPGSHKSH